MVKSVEKRILHSPVELTEDMGNVITFEPDFRGGCYLEPGGKECR